MTPSPSHGVHVKHWLYYYLGSLRLVFKQTASGIDAFQRSLAEKPDFTESLKTLAFLHAERREFEQAEAMFKRALAVQPKDADTHFNLGYVYDTQRKDEAAIECFRTAVELNPYHDRAWYGMGLALVRQHHMEDAEKAFRKATKIQFFSPYAWEELAKVELALGKPDKVREIITTVEKFEPRLTRRLQSLLHDWEIHQVVR